MNNTSGLIDPLLIVIVLYNTTLSNSESYQSISNGFKSYASESRLVDLMVINNGPLSIDCYADDSIFRLHFIEQLDNPGVSRAYNLAAKVASSLQKRWLLLLDQDTHLPNDFLIHYSQSVDHFPSAPVHAPRLYAGAILASPCGYRYYRGYVLSNLDQGIYKMQGRNVLNSGLLVAVDAFLRVGGYDEAVGLYFSDFVFFDRLKSIYTMFAVVNVDLQHDLSSSDYSSRQTAVNRFSMYCKGAYAAGKHDLLRNVLYFFTIGARSLLMNYRFKTWAFTKNFLQIWFFQYK